MNTLNISDISFSGARTHYKEYNSTPKYTNRLKAQVEKTFTDPTDVNNQDARVAGAVATGGVTGVAAVASRFKTLRTAATAGQKYVEKAVSMQAQNASLLKNCINNITKALSSSKLTSWLANAFKSTKGQKVLSGAGGALAIAITGAQLFSAGDMFREAVTKDN